jgi:hypothetical protein
MLIGLVGLIGSGKDTVADFLVKEHGFHRDSFAKSLKDAVSAIFGWDRELLEGATQESRMWRERIDPYWSNKLDKAVTPRYILQHWGTEVMRVHFHDSIWIDSFTARYRGGNIVLSDTRFINEINTIRNLKGKVVLVRRGPIPTQQEMQERSVHQSEWDWIGQRFDYEIDNLGNLEDLRTQVGVMIRNLLPDHQ